MSVSIALALLSQVAIAQTSEKANESVCDVLKNKKIFKKAPETFIPELLKKAGKKIMKIRAGKDYELVTKENTSDLKTKGDCASQGIIYTPNKNFWERKNAKKDFPIRKVNLSREYGGYSIQLMELQITSMEADISVYL